MKVRLQYRVADPGMPEGEDGLLEGWDYTTPDPLMDGPASRRVAVIDSDPDTGLVLAGARFVPPKAGAKRGTFLIADTRDTFAADFRQVSVFGAVMKVITLFEEPDVLGRPLSWGFDAPQLQVVPRAGWQANAFYHRASHSLKFCLFDLREAGQTTTVYTCLSPDIVAHETAHAILDGIAPDLYDATTPQALALHEAVADLAAVVFACRTRRLARDVLERGQGSISNGKAFSEIGSQFGRARMAGADRPLRDLANAKSLGTWGEPVLSLAPHDLSEVLTGALYGLLVWAFEAAKARKLAAQFPDAQQPPTPAARERAGYSASGAALAAATNLFKRLVFRGLDYLPPGEVSFADYGRAMVAADMASNPDNPEARAYVMQAFVQRGIVGEPAALLPHPAGFALPQAVDPARLAGDDRAAQDFAEAHRTALMIPPGTAFAVRPRLDVTKTTWRGDGPAQTRDCIFKLAWREARLVDDRFGEVAEISLCYGTTLVMDWETGEIRALLSTSRLHPSQTQAATDRIDAARLDYLAQGFASGWLAADSPEVQVRDKVLRVSGMGQRLHMAGPGQDAGSLVPQSGGRHERAGGRGGSATTRPDHKSG